MLVLINGKEMLLEMFDRSFNDVTEDMLCAYNAYTRDRESGLIKMTTTEYEVALSFLIDYLLLKMSCIMNRE